MKKCIWFFIFSLLFILQSFHVSLAAYPRTPSPADMVSKIDQEDQPETFIFSDLSEVSKKYGCYPHLCGGEIWGYNHAKTCMDLYSSGLHVADTTDSGVVDSIIRDPEETVNAEEEEDIFIDPFEDEEIIRETIADPLEPLNRVFFHFNDKLYLWFLRPVAKGYNVVVPKPARLSIRNFFHNLAFPIRFVNCLLQAKFKSAAIELGRFVANSTIGLAGLFDVAGDKFDLKKHEEDFGQTLGVYGFGPAFYINWPILGPSSLRDTFGMAGDFFLDPWIQANMSSEEIISIKAYERVNSTSLSLGEYEDMKKAALDPYIAIRDAYFQYRKKKITD